MLLIEGTKITAVGKGVAIPAGATMVDARGGWILPGLVDAHTTIGLNEERRGGPPDELSDPNTAQLLVLDGLNPFDKRFTRLVRSGITSALVTPGRANVIGGQAAVVRLDGRTADDMALRSPAGVKLSLGEGPKSAFGGKSRLPGTRMGSAFIVRKALLEAADYARKWKDYEAKAAKATGAAGETPPARPKTDLALEPLARLLDGRLTAYIETYRADDIVTALRLVDEFKVKAVLIGCSEGSLVAGRSPAGRSRSSPARSASGRSASRPRRPALAMPRHWREPASSWCSPRKTRWGSARPRSSRLQPRWPSKEACRARPPSGA